jgi:hypothetical protein
MSEIIPAIAFRDRRVIQLEVKSEYDVWLPATSFEWVDGEWLIDGMEPYEWADAVLGEDD